MREGFIIIVGKSPRFCYP